MEVTNTQTHKHTHKQTDLEDLKDLTGMRCVCVRCRWEADQFDKCIDNLPKQHGVILIDYSMNWPHVHAEGLSGEHWAHVQTKIIPVVLYLRNDKTGEVGAHIVVYMADGRLKPLKPNGAM